MTHSARLSKYLNGIIDGTQGEENWDGVANNTVGNIPIHVLGILPGNAIEMDDRNIPRSSFINNN